MDDIAVDDLVRITVRVRPGASRTRVGGAYADALVVAVGAPAVDGRANEAVVAAVADAFGLRSRDVRLVRGDRSRTKVLELTGDRAVLERRFEELRGPD